MKILPAGEILALLAIAIICLIIKRLFSGATITKDDRESDIGDLPPPNDFADKAFRDIYSPDGIANRNNVYNYERNHEN